MRPAPIDPPEIWKVLWDGFEGAVGWDVGANCGQTIPLMLERFRYVHAFEPAVECWSYLDDFDSDHLTVHHLAVSDHNGTVNLMAIPEKIDTGQLVTAGVCGMEWHVDMSTAEPRQIDCRSVDSLVADHLVNVEAPDFMKIDVEGHELNVLYGARKTLSLARPDLLIEFHSPELHKRCTEFLHSFGYTVDTVRHPHYPADSDMWHQHGWIRATQ